MKKYISVDVEASGTIPGKYSMLSVGACLVDDPSKQFYAELKPISFEFDPEAMKIGSLGLKCLEEYRRAIPAQKDKLDPKHEKFDPRLVLNVLEKEGLFPIHAMQNFEEWIKENTTKKSKPIIAAAPILFDGMYISWYFNTFLGHNPFGFSGEDINSVYRGFRKNVHASIKDLKMRQGELPHNALEDAIQQAKEFKYFLDQIRQK
ncbi:hypothetical protein HZA97_07795 [Candidatus Woesearchaeota archaeon]|nr:hypothetical protein [Candidatus Woesearchaeota archaeon]